MFEEKYMMATKAIHLLGDISRKKPDLCHVTDEDEENYIGMWSTGYGFFDVKFLKKTTRGLTQEEIKYYNSKYVQISNNPPTKLKVG